MAHNYTGRIILILALLYAGLFGVPFIVDGIFSVHPFNDPGKKFTSNLRAGIDIAGGTSLVYQIKKPDGYVQQGTQTLAEQVAGILSKRINALGTRTIPIIPQGDDRLEIRLPRSSSDQDSGAKVKAEYRAQLKKLQGFNISYPQVVYAVEELKGDARAKALSELDKGFESRKNLFAQLTSLYDRYQGLKTQYDDAQKAEKKDTAKIEQLAGDVAQARKDYSDAQAKIDATNLQLADIESALEGTVEPENKDDPKQRELIDSKRAELEKIKKALSEQPRQIVAKLAELYPKFAGNKGNIDDVADLKRQLKGAGVLEFHILVDDPARQQPEMVRRIQSEGTVVKAGDESRWYLVERTEDFGHHVERNPRDGKFYCLAWVAPDPGTGAPRSMVHKEGGQQWALQRAYPTQDNTGHYVVGFEFDEPGAVLFSNLTGSNLKKSLATILDNKIITAPTIQSQISKQGIITLGNKGNATAERNDIINKLNAGALPATLADEPISERDVASTVGDSNLKAGLLSCLIGLIVVSIFMFFYYHFTGLVAVIALAFNMILIIGVLAMMGTEFTLPGIAGLVLTIGVSVDANVLIFERLREEELRGLTLKLALRNAYDRAFTAILDSNVTTAITSAFLAYFGSEDVKGFGLTLLIGILSSMFAALFVTRVVFDIAIEKFGVRKFGSFPLSNPWWNKLLHPKIDWMSKIPYFLAFSIIFAGLGMVAFVQNARNGSLLDVEFKSGTEVQFTTNKPMTDGDVHKLIASRAKEVPQPTIVAMGSAAEPGKYKEFSIVTANADRQQVSEALYGSLKSVLNVAIPSKFTGSNDTLVEQAILNGTVMPVVLKNSRFAIAGRDVPEAVAFENGAAVKIENLDPPLKIEDIRQRIDRAIGETGDSTLTKFEVVRLDNELDETKPATKAVALISNSNLRYARSQADWQDKLARPFWKAVYAGVGRAPQFEKVTNINAQVAGDTQRAAIFATIGSLVAIMIWIWVRFGDHKYGTATVAAMVHDTILVVGAVGLSHWLDGTFIGNILGIEGFRVNLTLVAAILTIMGYSMVDTIVVFDRIREIRGKYGVLNKPLINDAVNQTLSRTLLTAGTTMTTVFVMYVWGGPAIHGFTFVLVIGILIGTYSSIAIAAPILLVGADKHAGQPAAISGATAPKSVQKVGA